ncbi:hypothetical protein RclHR1_00190004 [Rhizophagus clarus]|uniref:Uncharacterized protein n=1 Tax=Rhizophagus clarus TaxID=94130 RepID=A0A2Z6R3R3_9GLOM|nr:hypothetical protein RclHR1_00190004 [Rhizophagus clarus]GES90362.1 hypothetical protein RCL_jg13469.t1 [Rhizophagus clarus]
MITTFISIACEYPLLVYIISNSKKVLLTDNAIFTLQRVVKVRLKLGDADKFLHEMLIDWCNILEIRI